MAANGNPGRNFWGCGGGGGERDGVGGGHGGDGVVVVAYDANPTDFCTLRSSATKLVVATGGFISEHLNPDGISVDRVHMFSSFQNKTVGNSSDAGQADQYFVVSEVNGDGAADILLVGGGGGGGYKGGGGGGGQVVTAPITLTVQTYIAKVGAGGQGDMPTPAPTGMWWLLTVLDQ